MRQVKTTHRKMNSYESEQMGKNSFTGAGNTTAESTVKDFEVVSPPDDSVSSLAFSPSSLPKTYLVAGSWDKTVRFWEVQNTGETIPRAFHAHQGPVLDVAWSDDGSKVFSSSSDRTVKMWDLNCNQAIDIARHDAPVKTVHWIKASNYSCVMTGSWDKSLKFWDTRTPKPVFTIHLPERCYCADVLFPMAVVGTADRKMIVYYLDGTPTEFRRMDAELKTSQTRCVSIFVDQKTSHPVGFAAGGTEGRVAVQHVNPQYEQQKFTFKCHRSQNESNTCLNIYPVNDVSFNNVFGQLATVGADGKYNFWDKNYKRLVKTSDQMGQSLTRCCFSARGDIFAYAVGYDWSKGHEFYNSDAKNYIFLHPCFEELKPPTQP